jgi:hypothetical protein
MWYRRLWLSVALETVVKAEQGCQSFFATDPAVTPQGITRP